MSTSRRQFLEAAAGAVTAAVSAAAARPIVSRRPPNILFCVADDWGWPHAGAYGDKVLRTPAFDRVAREGALFTHAFCAAPSCTPSRAAMLTGQAPHRLAEGGNLHGFLPARFPVYPDILEGSGYRVGFTGKGWGPGRYEVGGRTRNPAGPAFKSFGDFLAGTPRDRPFVFWFGSQDPHRPYEAGSGGRSGLRREDVIVPPYLPDAPEVRSDILDYYFEAARFDADVGRLLDTLEAAGMTPNTLVVVTGDNGWPFPRAKANLYDAGTRQPFALRWPEHVRAGQVHHDFISLVDVAPTFIEAAGLKPPPEMTGRSILALVEGRERRGARNSVFLERERHAYVREGNVGYPSRAIRASEFLYIRNHRPDRWPAGDPEFRFAVGPFGDCDNSPTKDWVLGHPGERYYTLGFDKRPGEELYDLRNDPHQIRNVADRAEYAAAKGRLRADLEAWMKATQDPRGASDDDHWDRYPYYGEPGRPPK